MNEAPIVILHGWSDQAKSFDRLGRLMREQLHRQVEEIFLVDWLSLDDEVTYADLSEALQRAWKAKGLPTAPQSVDVVIHSTGALVIRDWMTRFYEPEKNPVHRFLMLAPANFGSPLAHKGRAFYGRIIKGWRNGLQNGDKILSGLELASDYTWELAEKDMLCRKYYYGAKRVKATVLVGNQGYDGVRAAANEPGGDGTVRVSTANLNVNKMEIDLASDTKKKRIKRCPVNAYHRIAFGIMDGETHGSIIAKADETPNNPKTLEMITKALTVTEDGWENWCRELDDERQTHSLIVQNSNVQKHEFVNIVTRVRDDIGNPVDDYFIEFFEGDPDKSAFGSFFHRDALRSVHRHKENRCNRSLYLNLTLLKKRMAKADFKKLTIRIHAEPQVDELKDTEDDLDYDKKLNRRRVGYSGHREVSLTHDEVLKEFIPHQTLLVDIILKREIAHIVLVRKGRQ